MEITMSKDFENAAMRAMADDIYKMFAAGTLDQYADLFGLGVTSDAGHTTVFPLGSPRVNPACVVISQAYLGGASSIMGKSTHFIFTYKAGEYDLARECPKAQNGREAESSSLRTGQDRVYQQRSKGRVSSLL